MDSKIQKKLSQEFIVRSYSSPPGYIAVAFVFLFFNFNEQLQNLIYFLVALITILSLLRFYLHKKYFKKEIPTPQLQIIYTFIVLSALAFSVLVLITWDQFGLYSIYGLTSVAILLTILAGSMVTISMNTFLHILFASSLCLPFSIHIFLVNHLAAFSHPLFWLAILQIIYSLHQGYQNKLYAIEKIKADFSLEEANQNLIESQQNLVEQTAKSAHASRLASLGEMAAGIAHEVNNPLAIIHASVEQLDRLASEETKINPRFKSSTVKIQNAVSRIERIVRALRTFSKQGDLNPMIKVTIHSIVQDTLDLCAEKFRLHGIDLILNCPDSFEVECRAIQISQILINLLNNAYDAIESQPDLKEKFISITCRKVDDSVCLFIANSGPSLSEKVKEKIFQPFFTTKEIGKGTGLGLSISKNIAHQHGGDLYLDQDMKLTTFCLKLPLLHPEKEKPSSLF